MPIARKSLVCMVKRILPNISVSVVETEESQCYNGYFPLCQFTLQGQGRVSHSVPQSSAFYVSDSTHALLVSL